MSTEHPARAAGGPFVLGLIGRTGSGKSTVARALEQDGAVVIDADELGHEVTDHDPETRLALVAEYGTGIYRADGTLDRARVAERVFSDPAARERLDRLVHPRIIARARARLEALEARRFEGVVVLDAALLLDWGLERWCDAVLAVLAPERLQIERLGAARGWTPEQARQRLSVQRSQAAFRDAADVALINDGTRAALEAAAREAVRTLRDRRAARKESC